MAATREYSNPLDEIKEIEHKLSQAWCQVSTKEKGKSPELRKRMKEIRHQLKMIRELRDSLWGQLKLLKRTEEKSKK
jgi:hypothetical protein